MLKLARVNQFYGESHTLWDVDLAIPKGSCTCLMGRNGMGKTTLLKCAMGLQRVRNGTIELAGTDITNERAEARARQSVGYVPQGREVFPLLTVEENLRTGLLAKGDASGAIPDSVFELFPVLKQMLGRRGGDLSGGQQQQLALARALLLEPSMLILDEPTEGIQPNIVRDIGDVIVRLNRERGITVLLVEQKLAFARRVADRFSLIDKGRIVAAGAMGELNEELVRRHLTV